MQAAHDAEYALSTALLTPGEDDGIETEMRLLEAMLAQASALVTREVEGSALVREALAEHAPRPRYKAVGPSMAKVAVAGLASFPAVLAPVPSFANEPLPQNMMLTMARRPAEVPPGMGNQATAIFPFARPAAGVQRVAALAPALSGRQALPLTQRAKAALTQPRVTVTTKRANSTTFYQVTSGDTLYAIARDLLGSGARWRELYAANKTRIGAGYMLQPGMRLVVPGALAEPVVAAAPAAAPVKATVTAPVQAPAQAPVRMPLHVAAQLPAKVPAAMVKVPAAAVKEPVLAQEPVAAKAVQALPVVPTAPSSPFGARYQVRPGDSLYTIAQQQLHDPKRWREIVMLNKQTLGGRTMIYPQQWLNLPKQT